MDIIKKNVVLLCLLVLGIGFSTGCSDNVGSGGFSFSFNTDREEKLAEAAKKYDSLCKELESRDFKEVKKTETPDMVSSHYEGKYNGFHLTVETRYLLRISKEAPEFFYDVSFEQTTDTNALNKASKDFRALMEKWCEQ